MNDELMPIPGYEGLYSITSDGRIWSLPKRWINNGGWKSHDGKWLKLTVDGCGYFVVNLTKGDTVRRWLVHRLVALAWLPNSDPQKYKYINHLNGQKQDNHYTNLEWCTRQRNIQHSWDLGLRCVTPAMVAMFNRGRAKAQITSHTPEANAKRARSNTGKKLSEAAKAKLSLAHLGKPKWKLRGVPKSAEHKAKISETKRLKKLLKQMEAQCN